MPTNEHNKRSVYTWGVDCGSTIIKAVVYNEKGELLHKRKERTLFPLAKQVQKVLCANDKSEESPTQLTQLTPFKPDGSGIKPNHRIITTGYGRHHIDFANDSLTEIKAHFLGVKHLTKTTNSYTLIDIGGQDSKIISIKDNKIDHFAINRKCAAGTGAYIEELAHRLELKLENLPDIARRHDKKMYLNSYCTVFAAQEVIKVLMNGEKIENLIQALYESVAKRVLEITQVTTDTLFFSGGVMQYHPVLMDIFQDRLKNTTMSVIPDAQYCGAIGAAHYGIKSFLDN